MIFRHRTQPKREEGEEGWEGEEGRREGFVLLEVPYKLRFRTPTCLGSYSCCNNLLGILLHHPSRTAATGGCDIDILHGLRQRVAATEDGGAAGPVVDNDAEGPVALVK